MELTFNEMCGAALLIVVLFIGGVLMLHGAGLICKSIEGWWINRNNKGMVGRKL